MDDKRLSLPGGWLYSEMVYLVIGSHPSNYSLTDQIWHSVTLLVKSNALLLILFFSPCLYVRQELTVRSNSIHTLSGFDTTQTVIRHVLLYCRCQ